MHCTVMMKTILPTAHVTDCAVFVEIINSSPQNVYDTTPALNCADLTYRHADWETMGVTRIIIQQWLRGHIPLSISPITHTHTYLESGSLHWWMSGARLTKAYDVTIQRHRNSYAKIKDSKMDILRCPLKFHTKFWTHTPQNVNFTRC